jgi:predicted amidohydrolase
MPEIGSGRVESAEFYVRAQVSIIELVAGKCAELILHPELPRLGPVHDEIEAAAFARVATASATSPVVAALLAYAEAEATALNPSQDSDCPRSCGSAY